MAVVVLISFPISIDEELSLERRVPEQARGTFNEMLKGVRKRKKLGGGKRRCRGCWKEGFF